jgi:hypothetical protein
VGVRRQRVKAVKLLAVSAVSGRVLVALQLNLLHVKVMAMADGLSCVRERERERERAGISAHSTTPVLCEQCGLVRTYIGSVTKWLPTFCFWLEITENCVRVLCDM